MSLPQALLLFGIALVAGAQNSVAGGGSFLTVPVLIFTGVLPKQANATNTLALWPGTVAEQVGPGRFVRQVEEGLGSPGYHQPPQFLRRNVDHAGSSHSAGQGVGALGQLLGG